MCSTTESFFLMGGGGKFFMQCCLRSPLPMPPLHILSASSSTRHLTSSRCFPVSFPQISPILPVSAAVDVSAKSRSDPANSKLRCDFSSSPKTERIKNCLVFLLSQYIHSCAAPHRSRTWRCPFPKMQNTESVHPQVVTCRLSF